MSGRNVPFLLNAAPVQPDTWADRILWTHFPRRRFSGFDRLFSGVDSIIDFGGTPAIWLSIGRRNIVLLNIDEEPAPTGFLALKGDARKTSFPDTSFDLPFSNSTIEHVGTREDQQAFAREICRAGKRAYCQTPARSFFFEPHYFTPFLAWFGFLLKQYWFVRYCTYHGIRWKPSREQVGDFKSHLRLLNYSEMQQLFTHCKILRGRFLGMTKAYIAIR